MAFKVITVSLLVACVSHTHGAAIPDQLMNQVQDFLVNPEPLATAMGMRVKRSTGDWDKEFDMEALGLSFKLKYVDPAHPIKGGKVHMKFPAHRFVKSSSFDDVELDFDFKGGEADDGLFEMKFDYKFVQKFTFFADRLQQGTVTMFKTLENGMYKTNMTLDSNAKKLFEIYLESNLADHFAGKATFDHNNTWEVTITMDPGKSINISLLQNGVGHSVTATWNKTALSANVIISTFGLKFNLDFQLNPDGKWGMKVTGDILGPLGILAVLSKDFKEAEINIRHRDNVLAFIKTTGDAKMNGIIPQKFKYTSSYTFVNGPIFNMEKKEGKAKIHFDGFSPKKVFTVEFIPTGGVQGKVDLAIHPTYPGFTYKFEITIGGKSYIKQESTQLVTADDANKWEATQTTNTSMAQDSPIYRWHCKYLAYPLPCATTVEETQKYSYERKNKKKFSYESETMFGGKKFSTFKIDTTKTPFIFVWDVPQTPYFYPFEGKVDLTFTPKENFGANYIFNFTKADKNIFSMKQDLTVTNDATKFELVEDNEATASEEFYALNGWYRILQYPVGEWKTGKQTRKFTLDKINKNEYMNKVYYHDKTMYDGKLYTENKLDTVNSPYVFSMNQPLTPTWYPFKGKFDLTFEPKSNHGFHVIYTFKHGAEAHVSGDHDFTINNDGDKFELKEISKLTMDEDSMLYSLFCKIASPLPCPKQIDISRKLFIDKKNKNEFFNKMTYDMKAKMDGKLSKTIKINTVKSPHIMVWNEPKSPFWMPSPINMFGLKMMKVGVYHKAGQALIMKTNLANMKLTMRRRPSIFIEFIKNKETQFRLNTKINASMIKADLKTMLHIPTLYSLFCNAKSSYAGCYNQWDGDFKIHADLNNKNGLINKFSINANVKKDNESQFEYELSTMVSPYVMKMNAPSILPMIFDDPRRHSLELTIDHKPGQMIHIVANTPEISSFKVTTNGVKRFLELNGRELVMVDYTKADKKFKQVVHLPNGEQVTIFVDWASWNPTNNKINVNFDTSSWKFKVNTDYNMTNVKDGKMMVRFHGENPMTGQFEFMRNVNWKIDANEVDAQWNGHSNFAKGPLAIFSPIDTTCSINYSFFGNVLRGNVVKTIDGQKWGLNISENKFNIVNGKP